MEEFCTNKDTMRVNKLRCDAIGIQLANITSVVIFVLFRLFYLLHTCLVRVT